MTLALNDPALVAELTILHDAYEAALRRNDTAELARLFWDSPHTIRYGVNEHLYGADAIAAFRSASPLTATNREILRRTITVFADHTASVMCEIRQTVAGQAKLSRQTQLWIRFADDGWRIAAAHVSLPATAAGETWSSYAHRAAHALDLPLAAAHLPGVALNLERTARIVAPLLAFPLPPETERAAVFAP